MLYSPLTTVVHANNWLTQAFAQEQCSSIDRMNDEMDTDRVIRKLLFLSRFSIQALRELVREGFH